MDKDLRVFNNDVIVPDIVQAKADAALDRIRKESTVTMRNDMNKNLSQSDRRKKERRYLHFFKNQAAAAACVIILAGAGITAAAAGFHLWSRGMQGTIQATPEEQQKLIDQGIAVADDSSSSNEADSSLSRLSVTDKGITVVPDTVIVDDWNAHISFSVQGYSLAKREEPFFNDVKIYPDSEAENTNSNDNVLLTSDYDWEAAFYDGTSQYIAAGNDTKKAGTYDDGTPHEYTEDGKYIGHYTDDQGKMSYVVSVKAPEGTSLVGKKLHIDLGSLGTVDDNGNFSADIDGNWDFTITLPDITAEKNIIIDERIEGTNFILDDVEMSPTSIRLNYSPENEEPIHDDSLNLPIFTGVVLKDGTQYTYINGGGSSGYTNESHIHCYESAALLRMVNPDDVAALLIYPTDSNNENYVRISIEK